jgi:hypothetical protein
MATVRSINPTKPPERLLTRRLTRASSAIPISQRKVTLSKTTPIPVTTIKRRKSSRMSSKKSSVTAMPATVRLNSFTATSDNNDLTSKMASTTITELPLIRQTSRISDTNSITSSIPIPQINSDKQIDEPQDHTPISNNINETLSSSPLSIKSSTENIEFTVESFDTIRTVGTGKIFLNNLNKKFYFHLSQEHLVESNLFVIVIQIHFMH